MGQGEGGWGARVSDFFSKDPNLKKIFFWGGGGWRGSGGGGLEGGGGGELELVKFCSKNPNLKKEKKNWGLGGGGEG